MERFATPEINDERDDLIQEEVLNRIFRNAGSGHTDNFAADSVNSEIGEFIKPEQITAVRFSAGKPLFSSGNKS